MIKFVKMLLCQRDSVKDYLNIIIDMTEPHNCILREGSAKLSLLRRPLFPWLLIQTVTLHAAHCNVGYQNRRDKQ